jgi:hypothetical protein
LQGAAEHVVHGTNHTSPPRVGFPLPAFLFRIVFSFSGIGEINHASRVETVATVLDYAYVQLSKGEKVRRLSLTGLSDSCCHTNARLYRRPRCPKALAVPKHDGLESAWEGSEERRLKFRAGFLGRPRPC